MSSEEMITGIELSEKETARFSDWLNAKKAGNVDLQACVLDALNQIENDLAEGSDAGYELGRNFTLSGNPEYFSFDMKEIAVETQPGDD